MNRTNQNTTATFAEVLSNAGVPYQQQQKTINDNKLMIYFQGVKIYIPEGVSYDTLLTTLRALKQL